MATNGFGNEDDKTEIMNFGDSEFDSQENRTRSMPPAREGYRVDEPNHLDSHTSLLEVDPSLSAAQVLRTLEDQDKEPEPEKKRFLLPIIAVCGAVLLIGGGIAVYGLSGEPDETVVTAEEPVESSASADPEAQPSSPEEAPAEEEQEKVEEESETPTTAETEESAPEEVKTQEAAVPDPDPVSKVVKTSDGTEIHKFKDSNMVPYEKFPEGATGVSESTDNTGNNMNDEYLDYRTDLGLRHVGSLSPEVYSERTVRDAMTAAVDKSTLGLQVPDKPDYSKARLYSSGYTVWPISDGYVMVMGDSQAVAIIAPGEKDEALTQAAVNSDETLIPQRYADQVGVSFGPLKKSVSGAQDPSTNPEEWQ